MAKIHISASFPELIKDGLEEQMDGRMEQSISISPLKNFLTEIKKEREK